MILPLANFLRYEKMEAMTKGPLQTEMEALLTAAFSPTQLAVINDSASHSGHSGDDGSGESHFTVESKARLLQA